MKRILKFRAWDGKTMYQLEALKDKSNHYLEIGSDGFWLYASDDGRKITSTIDGGSLLQYTGLKDKNGKELYEGDIISSGSWKMQIPSIYELINMNDICDLFYDAEVIGNIYENSELLK